MGEKPSPNCEGCCGLQKQVTELRQELEQVKKKLEKSDKQLTKAEFERDSSSKYVESFREQVSELHKKLDAEKKRNAGLEEHMIQTVDGKGTVGDWSSSGVSSDVGTDIATSIREAAKDIATSIREAAQQATTNNGFVYDETTGLYYDYNTGYYYDPSTRLYYDYQKGIYYTYDADNGTYHFYSQVATSVEGPAGDVKDTEGTKGDKDGEASTVKEKKEKVTKIEVLETGSEDGEIIDVDDEDEDDVEEENEDDKSDKEEEFPPCIRAIVIQSDTIPVGSLNIVTCMGITLGRLEGNAKCLYISDIEVSKEHAKIHYDNEKRQYFLTDLGSQNGTFVNGTRLSERKVMSEPHELSHGEQVMLGATTFVLHIHPGNETCDECEPGQVQAQLKAKEMEDEVQITRVVAAHTDGGDANVLRKKELKRLKKRYMLQNSDHEVNSEIASNAGGKYKDRAHVRRKKVGSDVPSSKLDDAPASVFKPIKNENKGRVMLEKMGWIDGEGLGKTKSGRIEPVLATVRETGCGLGYGGIKSIDMTSQTSKAIFWRKAQERYEATDVLNSTKTYSNENSGKRKNEEIDMFAETVDV